MFSEVAPFILDSIGVAQLPKKADLFEDVLPLFHALFPHIRHLFDSHDLFSEGMASIIHGAKASMTNFSEIFEDPVRIIVIK